MKKIVLFAFIICLAIFSCNHDGKDDVIIDDAANNQTTKAEKQILYDETIKVDAGSYVKYGFFIKFTTNIHLEVKSDLDFNVWLISEDEIDDFERGETFGYNPNASRQKITSFSTDIVLGLGWHYVVLDNKYSWITPKNISIKLVAG